LLLARVQQNARIGAVQGLKLAVLRLLDALGVGGDRACPMQARATSPTSESSRAGGGRSTEGDAGDPHQEELETWLTSPWAEAVRLQRPLPDGSLRIVASGERKDEAAKST
jgi:hypothetical protein